MDISEKIAIQQILEKLVNSLANIMHEQVEYRNYTNDNSANNAISAHVNMINPNLMGMVNDLEDRVRDNLSVRFGSDPRIPFTECEILRLFDEGESK